MEKLVAILLMAGAVVVVIIVAVIAAKRRREALAAFASAMGFAFAVRPGRHHAQYERFHPFRFGRSRRSTNLVWGHRGEMDWEFFDYQYVTGSGKSRRTHHYGIAVAKVGLSFARMEIRPEGIFDKVAATFGFDDIDFESDEFSRKYYVKCANRKLAYALIHPQMIEYLLRVQKSRWQFDGDTILICRHRKFPVAELPGVMSMVEGFVKRIPDFVRQDIRLPRGPEPRIRST